jgi:hypothetical protein
VKWIQRPSEHGGLFQTGIELDEPGNFWGLQSPPSDWLPFCGPASPGASESKAKTVAVLRPEAPPTPAKEERGKAVGPRAGESATLPSSKTRPVGQLIGGFQQQMESMLSEAAETVVRERATTVLDELRGGLREEVKRVVLEATSSGTGSWIDQSVKQMNQIGEEAARARHAQWTKKIESDLQQALKRIETRQRELEVASEKVTTKAQERLQGFLDTSRKDTVDRIIGRLKEQSAPVIDQVRTVTAQLTKREEELAEFCRHSVEKSAVQIEENCTRLDKQFEMMLRERLDSTRIELERAASAAAKAALESVRGSAQQQEAEAKARVREALDPITDGALASLKEKAAEISRQFVGEMSHYSRSHLEFVSGAISELAKGIGKLSKS